MKLARFLMVALGALSVPAAFAAGCGGSEDAGDPGMASSDGSVRDRVRLDAPYHPDASCPVTIETPDILGANHVPEGTPHLQLESPSSGDHYPIWAAFREYGAPVPWGYLVHSMEHGAVVLLYKCDQACPAIVDELRKIRESMPADPLCAPDVRTRVILAPAPDLDVPVAAAAWGWTYKAQCVDVPTLTEFAREHYAQSPENICSQGREF